MRRIILLCTLLAGCRFDIPEFVSDDDGPIDAAFDAAFDAGTDSAAPPDSTATECPAPAEPTQSPSCPAAAPICTEAGTCRQCAHHYECDSGACDLDGLVGGAGRCVSPADISYVEATAPGGNMDCTESAPCRTIALGLVPDRNFVVIRAGTYAEGVTINNVGTVSLIGYGATVDASPQGTPELTISGVQADSVSVYGLTLSGSQAQTLAGAQIAPGKSVTFVDVTIEQHGGAGIVAQDANLIVTRSTIRENQGGGISVTNSHFEITNNMIHENGEVGSSGSTFGGILVEDSQSPSTDVLAFNTIAANVCAPEPTCNAAGIRVVNSFSALAFHSNIVATNGIDGNTATTQVIQASGLTCSYSLIQPAFPGTENITGNPAFVAPGTDYHLMASSPALGEGMPSSGILEDFDGDPRSASAPDIGADEL